MITVKIPWHRATTHEQRLIMVQRYAREHASMAAIGREFGVTGETVRRVLLDMGVELRPDPKRGKPFGTAFSREL